MLALRRDNVFQIEALTRTDTYLTTNFSAAKYQFLGNFQNEKPLRSSLKLHNSKVYNIWSTLRPELSILLS
jgi:hypothetical protein